MQKKVETARFTTFDDNGNEYTIIELTTMTSVRPVAGVEQWRPGSKSYQSTFGESANRVDDITFQMVMSDVAVKTKRS